MMTDRRRISGCLWTLALVVAFFIILDRLRIFIVVRLPWWGLILLFLGLAFAIFLVIDHLLHGGRP